MNAFGFPWSGENCWVNAPYKAIGRVWRALREQQAVATLLVPMWESATWWRLVVPEGPHLAECVVDWVWLPRDDPDLFIGGRAPGRTILPPNWPLWPSGLISREENGRIAGFSPRETVAFKAVVKPAGATLGIGKYRVTSSGWASLDVSRDDPVEVALAARLHHSAIAHVAGSTSKEYVKP